MSKKVELKPPIETVIEFVFFGLFDPKNYDPSWLYRKEIFHPREVKQVTDIKINEAEVFYSTDLISFNITFDSFVIKTNSELTYDSLFEVAKRIVNVLRTELRPEFKLNIRYHFRHPSDKKVNQMKKLLNDSFWDGMIDGVQPQSATITKSIQQKEFYLESDINISICRREDAKGKLIHVFFGNLLNLGRLPNQGKGRRTPQKNIIAKFMRLDNDLINIKNRNEIIAKKLANKYFSDHV